MLNVKFTWKFSVSSEGNIIEKVVNEIVHTPKTGDLKINGSKIDIKQPSLDIKRKDLTIQNPKVNLNLNQNHNVMYNNLTMNINYLLYLRQIQNQKNINNAILCKNVNNCLPSEPKSPGSS